MQPALRGGPSRLRQSPPPLGNGLTLTRSLTHSLTERSVDKVAGRGQSYRVFC